MVCLAWQFLVACVAVAGEPGVAQEPALVQGEPTVERSNAGYEVSFSLARPTDVTIRIVDAQGKVVRHLASGMVGLKRCAAPLASGTLSQRVLWDGNDDAGNAAPPEGCRVVLGVGTKAKFDRFILGNPNGFGVLGAPNWAQPGAMAVNAAGELHLVQQYGVHYSTLRVFDRQARFVRCVWPLSFDKPRETLEAFLATTVTVWPGDVATWAATDWQGRTVPRSVSHSAFYWYGVRSNAMAATPSGRIILTDAHVTSGTELLAIAANGLPQRPQARTPWLDSASRGKVWDLAVGPEGDVYVSDKAHGIVARLDGSTLAPVSSFHFQGTQPLDQPTYLLGTPKWQKPGVWDPLWALTVDKEGRVWLANPRDDAIQIFRKDGLLLRVVDQLALAAGNVKIKAGQLALGANHKSGAVYLNLPAGKERRLVKLKGADALEVVAETSLPAGAKRIAVDSEAALVWVLVGSHTLLRIQDRGDKLETRTIDGLADKTLAFPRLLSVSGGGRLYLTDAASNYIASDVEGRTFRRLAWYGAGGHGYCATDSEGNWYVSVSLRENRHEIWKLSADGNRLPIGETDAIVLEEIKEAKGLYVAGDGDIYVAVTAPVDVSEPGFARAFGSVDVRGDSYNLSRVDVYGTDGKLKQKGLVRLQGVNDVKLDRRGNIYVIEAGLCHGAHKRRAAKLDNRQFTRYTRLLKFGPAGGVRDGPGMQWSYQGLSGVSSYTCAGECPAGQLCVDADDRVWIADPALYNVAAVDTAGNLLFRVGTYGNEDCAGGGGDAMIPGTQIVRDPEIPLARPMGVARWKDFLLISDMYSHRVLRCRLLFSETKELVLPKH